MYDADADAAKVFGAVGCPPIKTEEQRLAWHRYVATLTARYREQISHYEVWNEPDGDWCWKHGSSGKEYGEFVIATVAAIRAGNAMAKVIAGATCGDIAWLCAVASTGALAHADARVTTSIRRTNGAILSVFAFCALTADSSIRPS